MLFKTNDDDGEAAIRGSTTTSTIFEPLLSSSAEARSRSVSPSSSLPQPPQPQLHHQNKVFLSFPLCISYSCIGMIMSLPSTALLYFVNNYIAIPVSLLPLYLSISFLPYSLKPSYAYISTSLLQRNLSQQIQIIFLLLACGVAYIITAFIPHHAILLSFILGFVRSITLAWPNFLLDLCLLDEVDNIMLSSHPPPPASPPQETSSSSTTLSYTEIAAAFQSQAATYRSIGCVLANVLALVLLTLPKLLSSPLQPPLNDKNHSVATDTINHRMFQFILICTGVLNFACAFVLWNNPRDTCTTDRHQPQLIPSSSDNNDAAISLLLQSNSIESETHHLAAKRTTMRLPSYDSIEEALRSPLHRPIFSKSDGPLEMDACIVDTDPLLLQHGTNGCTNSTNSLVTQRMPSSTIVNHNNPNHSISQTNSNSSIWLIILLQLLVVLLTLRQSMVKNLLTKIGWTCLVTILTALFFFCAYDQSSQLTTQTDTNENDTATTVRTQQHGGQIRVGLYLILRYSIPSVSYLMSSYVYTIFEEIPSILQFLSLFDMCVTTFACYMYSKYLSKYSSGEQLVWLIAITTILSGISSFGNVFLIRLLNPKTSTQQQSDDSDSMTTKIICTIVINAIIGFFNEWKFFPDVVLATATSASNNSIFDIASSSLSNTTTSATSTPPRNVSLAERTIGFEIASNDSLLPIASNPTIRLTRHDDERNDHTASTSINSINNTAQLSTSPSMRSVQYGTLLSCIDFGDQIGVLLAGPLIAIFHTTRSNGNDQWQHLEVLQIINSIMILLSAFLVFILIVRR